VSRRSGLHIRGFVEFVNGGESFTRLGKKHM
jgi:hypothetical protein